MMEGLYEQLKRHLKPVIYFTVIIFAQAIPHELGHAAIAILLGFKVTGISWDLFNLSFVSIDTSFNSDLFKLVLLGGGWGVCLVFTALYWFSHDPALRLVSRIFAIYGFFGGIFEAFFTHIYESMQLLSWILLTYCIVIVFIYDGLTKRKA